RCAAAEPGKGDSASKREKNTHESRRPLAPALFLGGQGVKQSHSAPILTVARSAFNRTEAYSKIRTRIERSSG
ncbi:MAG TPA: hypothetical protein VG099_16675, partial [Gemmataceae bacterium]|nr:hypothetical protein [Gemmataceae bacterium]